MRGGQDGGSDTALYITAETFATERTSSSSITVTVLDSSTAQL
jgi:hypothetical protein